jgi:G:T-mismatch repair DNA endonuclease (very short patch repair protein)
LASNVDRDALNEQRLRELGFSIVVVWECDVRKELEGSVRRVLDSLVTAEAFAEGESSDKMDRRFTEE